MSGQKIPKRKAKHPCNRLYTDVVGKMVERQWHHGPMNTTVTDTNDALIARARDLYWQGHRLSDIARKLNVKYQTLYSAKTRDGWDANSTLDRVNTTTDSRLCQLLALPEKSEQDWMEIERLTQILERTAKIAKFSTPEGKPKDLNPKLARPNAGRKKGSTKNLLTMDQVEQLEQAFLDSNFGYQHRWWQNRDQRIRDLLKSRQIGATWYFAREGLIDALLSGDNQIFASASRAQAEVFRRYIIDFVFEVTGVTLEGNPMVIPPPEGCEGWTVPVTLYFLSTNVRTAQGYHGHLYMDEYCWIGNFAEFRKVASGIAAHKKWRQTYFSTPSIIGGAAHQFWTGETHNKRRSRSDQKLFDLAPDRLRFGLVGPDNHWRNQITVLDAEAEGCDLFDLNNLRLEYSDEEFRNLFMCEWVDSTASYFTFDELKRGGVDSWDRWADFDPDAKRPLGDHQPVWLGYDPAMTSDNASLAVIVPPGPRYKKYRVVEKFNFTGMDFVGQAAQIRTLCEERYRVEKINIDTSTIGKGVFEMVKQFFPTATPIVYSVETKTRMVLKAKHLFSRGQVEFDSGWVDFIMAFLAIRQTATPSGRQATFAASRSESTGHADLAWATMHALDNTDFCQLDPDTDTGSSRTIVRFF